MDVTLTPPSEEILQLCSVLLTNEAVAFITDLTHAFKHEVNSLHQKRHQSWRDIKTGKWTPNVDILFPLNSQLKWSVNDVPACLKDRRIDLGDVNPADLTHFKKALSADVQGIQVDFDDGFCPNWNSTIIGHYNVFRAVRGEIVPGIKKAPVIMFRPRGWHLTEDNFLVDGNPVAGPLFDYGLHVLHNARILISIERGPFFYLPKIESASEAKLWDDIFVWTEKRFQIPIGTIKATVLIEDILAAFEMDEILFALKRHSAGLNCGIWDYCASIIARFGNDENFLMPDRNKYVNMGKTFLKKYRSFAVQVCRERGTFATGGMVASTSNNKKSIPNILAAKEEEIKAGVAGFLIYDANLLPEMQQLWNKFSNHPVEKFPLEEIRVEDLLRMPKGGVTKEGLEHNIQVSLLYIHHWLSGFGQFEHKSSIEDSATAEISRWQVRQWLMHQVLLENSSEMVTLQLILNMVTGIAKEFSLKGPTTALFIRLLTLRDPPQFITRFLHKNVKISDSGAKL